jgi:hypothetical protein
MVLFYLSVTDIAEGFTFSYNGVRLFLPIRPRDLCIGVFTTLTAPLFDRSLVTLRNGMAFAQRLRVRASGEGLTPRAR